MTAGALAVGTGLGLALSPWRQPEEATQAIASAPPVIIEQPTTVSQVAPVASVASAARAGAARAAATAVPNPFQRLARGAAPDPRLSSPAMAPAPTATYVTHQPTGYASVVTREWVKRLRSSCIRYGERERAQCERIADRVGRMLAETEDVDEQWVSAMQDELQRLFGSSRRAKDFSHHEVTCNANGCILYWHSSDYADWQGAGNVLLKDLFERSSFADFDLQNVERLGAFDPTTSIPWEVLVLERRQAGPGSD
jgi:hypothetical protein